MDETGPGGRGESECDGVCAVTVAGSAELLRGDEAVLDCASEAPMACVLGAMPPGMTRVESAGKLWRGLQKFGDDGEFWRGGNDKM